MESMKTLLSSGRQRFVEIVAKEVKKWDSPVLASVRIAQACLESNFGQSELALMARNFFGIKASYPWRGETYSLLSREFSQGQWHWQASKFRVYPSLTASCQDHAGFFESTQWRREYYREVLVATSQDDQAQALTGRYANDPDYGDKLMKIIADFNLSSYDGPVKALPEPKPSTPNPAYEIIDRRGQALGGQRKDRPLQAIQRLVWHYTGVARNKNRFITDHEAYWSKILGWNRGGYHFYIDSQGKIYQNYDLQRITWGVAHNNQDTLHISVEANHKNDYSSQQIASRQWLTLKLLQDLNLPADRVMGHWEVNNNTACPGYSASEMKTYRQDLAKKLAALRAIR